MEMVNAFKTELTHTHGNKDDNNNKIMIFFLNFKLKAHVIMATMEQIVIK
jgi:hypothetical protein